MVPLSQFFVGWKTLYRRFSRQRSLDSFISSQDGANHSTRTHQTSTFGCGNPFCVKRTSIAFFDPCLCFSDVALVRQSRSVSVELISEETTSSVEPLESPIPPGNADCVPPGNADSIPPRNAGSTALNSSNPDLGTSNSLRPATLETVSEETTASSAKPLESAIPPGDADPSTVNYSEPHGIPNVVPPATLETVSEETASLVESLEFPIPPENADPTAVNSSEPNHGSFYSIRPATLESVSVETTSLVEPPEPAISSRNIDCTAEKSSEPDHGTSNSLCPATLDMVSEESTSSVEPPDSPLPPGNADPTLISSEPDYGISSSFWPATPETDSQATSLEAVSEERQSEESLESMSTTESAEDSAAVSTASTDQVKDHPELCVNDSKDPDMLESNIDLVQNVDTPSADSSGEPCEDSSKRSDVGNGAMVCEAVENGVEKMETSQYPEDVIMEDDEGKAIDTSAETVLIENEDGSDSDETVLLEGGNGSDSDQTVVLEGGNGSDLDQAVVLGGGNGSDLDQTVVLEGGNGSDLDQTVVLEGGDGSDLDETLLLEGRNVPDLDGTVLFEDENVSDTAETVVFEGENRSNTAETVHIEGENRSDTAETVHEGENGPDTDSSKTSDDLMDFSLASLADLSGFSDCCKVATDMISAMNLNDSLPVLNCADVQSPTVSKCEDNQDGGLATEEPPKEPLVDVDMSFVSDNVLSAILEEEDIDGIFKSAFSSQESNPDSEDDINDSDCLVMDCDDFDSQKGDGRRDGICEGGPKESSSEAIAGGRSKESSAEAIAGGESKESSSEAIAGGGSKESSSGAIAGGGSKESSSEVIVGGEQEESSSEASSGEELEESLIGKSSRAGSEGNSIETSREEGSVREASSDEGLKEKVEARSEVVMKEDFVGISGEGKCGTDASVEEGSSVDLMEMSTEAGLKENLIGICEEAECEEDANIEMRSCEKMEISIQGGLEENEVVASSEGLKEHSSGTLHSESVPKSTANSAEGLEEDVIQLSSEAVLKPVVVDEKLVEENSSDGGCEEKSLVNSSKSKRKLHAVSDSETSGEVTDKKLRLDECLENRNSGVSVSSQISSSAETLPVASDQLDCGVKPENEERTASADSLNENSNALNGTNDQGSDEISSVIIVKNGALFVPSELVVKKETPAEPKPKPAFNLNPQFDVAKVWQMVKKTAEKNKSSEK